MPPLASLSFATQDSILSQLPVDRSGVAATRPVRGAVYATVNPTPIAAPRLVAASSDALALLGLDASEADTPELVSALAGNTLLPGSTPAAHCYAGHQFGSFAGQLGDGAAILLGQVVSATDGSRQELQLKGAGLTPFSRAGDGRKVLRSSLREFLASEAMHGLGIPTTRAGTLIVSGSDKVIRDITYSGNPQLEPVAVLSRIAPTFLRFGSFEVCKPTDAVTGRAGPSAGLNGQLLLPLVGHTIKAHFPHLWVAFTQPGQDISLASMGEQQVLDLVEAWFSEVAARTAHLVAGWQGVGFVHGVLNTDNMSVLGLTIDYGPFQWMDRFDSAHVSNGSDDGARYTYAAQPPICAWNLARFGEALASIPLPAGTQPGGQGAGAGGDGAALGGGGSLLPKSRMQRGQAVYEEELLRLYRAIFRRKLGLVGLQGAQAAAGADAAATGAGSCAAAAAAGGGAGAGAGGARPTWPLAANASPGVKAAAAAGVAAALDPGAGEGDGDGDAGAADDALVADLLSLMEATGADFTNTFRRLALVPMPARSSAAAAAAAAADGGGGAASQAAAAGANASASGSGGEADPLAAFLAAQLPELASAAEMAAASKPRVPMENLNMLMMLAGRDSALLHQLGVEPGFLKAQLAAHKAAAAWARTSEADKAAGDEAKWRAWLGRYRARLQREADAGVPPGLRQAVMAATNPRVVLRNWIAQQAIAAAETSADDAPCRAVLRMLADPFTSEGDMALEVPPAAAAAASGLVPGTPAGAPAGAAAYGGGSSQAAQGGGAPACQLAVRLQLDGKAPSWAAKLCVTCSS